jgi:hypothetical protein
MPDANVATAGVGTSRGHHAAREPSDPCSRSGGRFRRLSRRALPSTEPSGSVSPIGSVPKRSSGGRRLVRALVDWPLPVSGSRGYSFAEVTAGGIPLEEVDSATMASRLCPGLFLVGEMLDVDGRIGGFNFQWAWSTGWIAGKAVARET